eukprot:scaffold401_cov399-Prasinococcus_capsulatus_cf.AAC.41
MSFPTCQTPGESSAQRLLSSVEGVWRNEMSEAVRFLETFHPARYQVFNLCEERTYPVEYLRGRVSHYPFKDHNPPPLDMIGQLCAEASAWLDVHPDNVRAWSRARPARPVLRRRRCLCQVVVIHCKAGKGRTGLMVCSLLMYLVCADWQWANVLWCAYIAAIVVGPTHRD